MCGGTRGKGTRLESVGTPEDETSALVDGGTYPPPPPTLITAKGREQRDRLRKRCAGTGQTETVTFTALSDG
jgi:hypothetical protein